MYENNGGGLKFEFVLVLELWVLFWIVLDEMDMFEV